MKTFFAALFCALALQLQASPPQSQIISASPFVLNVPAGSTFDVLAYSQSGGLLTPLTVTINGLTTLGIYPFGGRNFAPELPFTVAGPATIMVNPSAGAKILITYQLRP